ncbi:MAG: hypothetical protein LBC88_03550, partial [Spirochaetaceae bacterium]|nr:hypothetical protein [Spirochaetaceae bacterium]
MVPAISPPDNSARKTAGISAAWVLRVSVISPPEAPAGKLFSGAFIWYVCRMEAPYPSSTMWASLKTSVFRDEPLKNACFAAHRARNRKGTSENNRFLEVP